MNQKNKYLLLGVICFLGNIYSVYTALSNGTPVNLLIGSSGLALVTGYFIGLSKN